MAKIAFDIKYRPEIDAGKYKVKVEEHEARIVCWDYNGDNLIVCVKIDGVEQGLLYDTAGRHMSKLPEHEPDLELYTDEPEELTEFEKRLAEILDYAMANPVDTSPQIAEQAKKLSPELLGIAYYQFEEKREKDGIITISEDVLQKMLDDKYKEGYECCQERDKERIIKAHLEGFAEGQEHADKRNREANSFHFPMYGSFVPPCHLGAPCTNPHHDCINCPRQGATGLYTIDTNIK